MPGNDRKFFTVPFRSVINPTTSHGQRQIPILLLQPITRTTAWSRYVYTDSPPCYETSFCDSLEIHGDTTSCDLQQDFSVTVFKNPECGARVNWFIDPSVVQSFQVVNDTSVLLRLNQAGQGWLYAKISDTMR